MFAIGMGGCKIALGVEWLRTLSPIIMDFQELYMSFKKKNHTHTLRGLQVCDPTIINSHRMEKLLKKSHHGVVAQFNTIGSNPPHTCPNMQQVLDHHQWVYEKPK